MSELEIQPAKRPNRANATTNPWTPEQLALLDRLGAENKLSWFEIGRACGHSAQYSSSVYGIRRKAAAEAGLPVPVRNVAAPRPWTKQDINQLVALREVEKKQFGEIDEILGRSINSSRAKYHNVKALEGHPGDGMIRLDTSMRVSVSPRALAERDIRSHALLHQSPTAALMGDPPPGRSALDRKQANAVT